MQAKKKTKKKLVGGKGFSAKRKPFPSGRRVKAPAVKPVKVVPGVDEAGFIGSKSLTAAPLDAVVARVWEATKGPDELQDDVVSVLKKGPEDYDPEVPIDEEREKPGCKDDTPRTVFDLDSIEDPLVGTPADVQEELDHLALYLQRHPRDHAAFQRIIAYMHKYLLGLVFKKFAFIKGYQESDVYQEALIAIFKKAVPGFRTGKGMSFLNFAKLCVNRHLITILHASKHRRKDLPMNTAISLDHNPTQSDGDDDGTCPLSNVIADQIHQEMPYDGMSRSECFRVTISTLKGKLSSFEMRVLEEHLAEQSYRQSARNIQSKYGDRCNQKSIDNALLRIKKKARELIEELGEDAEDMIPLVFSDHKKPAVTG